MTPTGPGLVNSYSSKCGSGGFRIFGESEKKPNPRNAVDVANKARVGQGAGICLSLVFGMALGVARGFCYS